MTLKIQYEIGVFEIYIKVFVQDFFDCFGNALLFCFILTLIILLTPISITNRSIRISKTGFTKFTTWVIAVHDPEIFSFYFEQVAIGFFRYCADEGFFC